MDSTMIGIAATLVGAAAGAGVAYVVTRRAVAGMLAEAEQTIERERRNVERELEAARAERKAAERERRAAEREAETIKREAIVQGREALKEDREHFEREVRERTKELRRFEEKLDQRESELDRRRERLDRREEEIDAKLAEIASRTAELEQERQRLAEERADLEGKLERIAGMTLEEARREVLARAEEAARLEAARLARRLEEEAKAEAERRAQKIVALAVQRYAGDYVVERTVSVVPIPDDSMKGRIIGREGRNIRSFEMITGVDLIIDDTPETVVISCHNPLRREVARRTLERLVEDGRIQPGRIEEVHQAVSEEVEEIVREAGREAVFELGLEGLHPELVRLMGINKFRTSYAQNILHHSVEVAYLCGMMADELGVDRQLARRAGFLHDIGKAVDQEFEGGHAQIGADLCRKFGESEEIVRAVAEHHDDPPSTLLGILVQAADALSAARPGARREMLASYVRRLEELEAIAHRHAEVERAYAIQAGRELRVILDAEKLDDDGAYQLAREIAAEIEAEMSYPGQIKVTVLRETRATAFAK